MDIAYLKKMMIENGFLLIPSPANEWSTLEENAWRQVCFTFGARYTPYPDRQKQDPDFLDKIDRQCLVIERAPLQQIFLDPKQLMPTEIKFHPETPPAVRRKMETLSALPRSLEPRRGVLDPLHGLEPNDVSGKPRSQKGRTQFSSDKSKRLNALRDDASDKPSGPIRVR